MKGCGMGREATNFLTEKGVRMVGTDAWSWDAPFAHTAKECLDADGAGSLTLPLQPDPAFIGTSIVGRGARFFLVAAVIRRFGDQARDLIDRYFGLVTLAFTVLLVGAFLLLKVVL